jgi:hypothetical protein
MRPRYPVVLKWTAKVALQHPIFQQFWKVFLIYHLFQSFLIKKRKQNFCCVSCATTFREKDEIFKINKIKNAQDIFKDPEKRNRLRDIGLKGGFGKKGYINNIYFYI